MPCGTESATAVTTRAIDHTTASCSSHCVAVVPPHSKDSEVQQQQVSGSVVVVVVYTVTTTTCCYSPPLRHSSSAQFCPYLHAGCLAPGSRSQHTHIYSTACEALARSQSDLSSSCYAKFHSTSPFPPQTKTGLWLCRRRSPFPYSPKFGFGLFCFGLIS